MFLLHRRQGEHSYPAQYVQEVHRRTWQRRYAHTLSSSEFRSSGRVVTQAMVMDMMAGFENPRISKSVTSLVSISGAIIESVKLKKFYKRTHVGALSINQRGR